MIDLEHAWEMLGGETFLGNTIEKACADSGISVSPDDVEKIVAEVTKKLPDIIEQAERETAHNMVRTVARREYQRFCRQCGIKPNSRFL